MNAVRIGLLAGLVAGSGCCLQIVSGDTRTDETSGGGSSSGGGGTTSGGTTTGGGACSGVYCSPSYVCDPADGICKCGGQICSSGNCHGSTGACLPGCSTDGGSIGIESATPGEAVNMPPADLNKTYDFKIVAVSSCAPGPFVFTALSQLPPGLALYPSGEVEGAPTMASNGVPFEFEVEISQGGAVARQNVLLLVR